MNWQATAQISGAEDGGTRLNGSLLESGMGVQLSKPREDFVVGDLNKSLWVQRSIKQAFNSCP